MPTSTPPTLDDVRRAARRLRGVAHRTPVLTSTTLDTLVGATVFLKAEGLQRAGAFKFRGAYNAISSLDAGVLARGVCACSSGNHAQAVALAARLCDTRATILMPHDAPAAKLAATRAYGAEVVGYDRYGEDREALVGALAADRGLHLVHPFDDPLVMAGAGTVALELLEDVDALDLLLVPVGGGGLIAGCATAVKALSPVTRVVGVEPAASDDVARSKASGRRERVVVGPTIADGQQLPSPGVRTWPVIDALVDDVVTVTDEEIVVAMRLLFERLKVVAEPSGATALAALLAGAQHTVDSRVGVVLSGANVDAARFATLVGAAP
ncbi:MAG: threo-3-hydroxy-L-aspartate ammonia-lyase [Solirubrobacteraceae bacterium]|nr:threo-3-hydroxy-L-aspartate ammonia-lyase [Solirubrobacteraceae bacterium]